jgi:glycosyltransferase involved in cell wall biosynthesis
MTPQLPKILFVCYDGYRTTNSRVRCYRFSEQLRKNGLDSSVFSFKDTLNASHDGEESYKVGSLERLSLLLRAASRLLKESRHTVFYIQKSGYFALAPLIAHFLRGNPLILDYDDYEYEQSWLSRPLLRLIAGNAIFCVAASHYLQEFLSKFNRKVYYIPTGVDTAVFHPRLHPTLSPNLSKAKITGSEGRKPLVFGWLGIIVDRPALDNVLMILDAFSTLEKKGLDFRLEIVGGGDYMEEVARRIAGGGSKKIFFLGRLPPEKIPSYLDKVDVGLFALARDTKYNRSKSPTKLFEYMAKGLAIISTPLGEAGLVIQDGRNGLVADGKASLASCAEGLIRTNGLSEKLGREALRTAAKDYSLEQLGARLAAAIRAELK